MNTTALSSAASLSTAAASGGVAASMVVIVAWIASAYGLAIPPEVAAAITTLIGSGAHWLGMYLTTPNGGKTT